MNTKHVLCTVVFAAFPASTALGVEIKQSIVIAEAPEATWQTIGGFCDIDEWHPEVTGCEEFTRGAETFRTLTFTDATTLEERLLDRNETSYTYEIVGTPIPIKSYRSIFAATPEGSQTRVNWSVSNEPLNAPDPDLDTMLDGFVQAGLDAISKAKGK